MAGIGKALAKKLAQQGVNVVLVAFPDALLDIAFNELSKDFPDLTFRRVCSKGPKLFTAARFVENANVCLDQI